MRVYLDSSAFAKRFLDETGSDAVRNICAEAEGLGLSVLCVPEIVSALSRRRREKILAQDHYDAAKRRLLEDVQDADIIDLTPSVVSTSVTVIETDRLRTLDALHIACALAWSAELFVSSDKRQLVAAERTGMNVREV